jgi:hypothetical protein
MSADLLKEDLKKAIAEKRVLVVVGAGVSMASTEGDPCAGWRGLIEHGISRCVQVARSLPRGWERRWRDVLAEGDADEWILAAEEVTRRLAGAEYARWLRESVGALTVKDPDVLAAIRDLGGKLATTNYDGLLEEVTGWPAVTWRDAGRIERVLKGDEEGIIHLHGYWDEPDSVVLGIRSYEDVTQNEAAQALQRFARLGWTLVFVGCGDGLVDPNIGRLLQWSGSVLKDSHYRHFILAPDAEVPRLEAHHPEAERLFVLGIGDRSGLADYLRPLAPSLPFPSPSVEATTSSAADLPASEYCFGRDHEVGAMVACLLESSPRPIPVLGAAGIGKSTVTLRALRDERVATRYAERRWFVRCDGAASGASLAAAIAERVGVSPGPELERRVVAALSSAPGALALDNLETPWHADQEGTESILNALSGVGHLALLRGRRESLSTLGAHPATERVQFLPRTP